MDRMKNLNLSAFLSDFPDGASPTPFPALLSLKRNGHSFYQSLRLKGLAQSRRNAQRFQLLFFGLRSMHGRIRNTPVTTGLPCQAR
jgi:hypothetical protein